MAVDAAGRLGLGTVQLGMDYGIANRAGRPDAAASGAILAAAAAAGFGYLDTAPAYGDSEAVVGALRPDGWAVRIVTKTPIFAAESLTRADGDALLRSLRASLDRLKTPRFHGLLVHHGADLLKPGAEYLISALHEAKARGWADRIGYSAYSPEEVRRIGEVFDEDIVQVPMNLLDQRQLQSGTLAALAARGTEIHVRSLFLQGLLAMDDASVPGYFDAIRAHLGDLRAALGARGLSMLEASLAFVLGCPEVSAAIIGCDSPGQVLAVAAAAGRPLPRDLDTVRWALSDERYINPAFWPAAAIRPAVQH